MKIIIIIGFFLLLVATIASNAQMKIGDNPNIINSNSLLELESTSKGVLVPRVALNDANAIAPLIDSVPAGMLVYSTAGTLRDGFYFWNGVKWLGIATTANVRSNYVLIKSAADFPVPAGGVITLVPTTLYEINGTIVLTNKIDLNGCTVKGMDRRIDKLVYTPTSGELFTGSHGGSFYNLTLSAPGIGSKLFNIDAGGSVTENLVLGYTIILGCDNIGLIKGFGGGVAFEAAVFIGNTNGVTLQDLTDFVGNNEIWGPSNRNIYEKFVGTFSTILKVGGKMQVLSAFSATALDISGITSITGGAELKATLFVGDGTNVTGTFSDQWEVESTGVNTQKDDVASGNLYVTSPAVTTFSAINTATKLLGATTSANLFRVTSTGDNELMYAGNKTKKFRVMCSLTATQSSSDVTYSFYIAKNGTVLPESAQIIKLLNSTDKSPITLSCDVSLSPNDYLEVWVENNTNTVSLTAETLNLSIK